MSLKPRYDDVNDQDELKLDSSHDSNSLQNSPYRNVHGIHLNNQESNIYPFEDNERTDFSGASEIPIVAQIVDSEIERCVIEGTVVIPEREGGETSDESLKGLIFAIIFATIIVAFYLLWNDSSSSQSSSKQLSPSSTSQVLPTNINFYEESIRDILLNVFGEDMLRNTSSIQYKIFQAFVEKMPKLENKSILSVNDSEKIIQSYSLLMTIMSSTRDPDKILEWLESEDVFHACQRYFVVCNDEGEVTKLLIHNQWISVLGAGIIATEIGEIKTLTHMSFARNVFHGTIPSEIGKLRNLRYLSLAENKLSGSIPTEFGQLHNMEMLLLQSNNLTDNIPSELGNLSRLLYMDVSFNMLNGTIPTELGGLNNLIGFKAYRNELTGPVDFFCNKNMTNVSYDIEMELDIKEIMTQGTVKSGFSVDCKGELRTPECSWISCYHDLAF